MPSVTVYQYTVLETNRVKPQRRWGTRAAIARLKSAKVIESSATLIEESIFNTGGFTPLDFDPLVN